MTGILAAAHQRGDNWNLATVWEVVADTVGDRPALCHGDVAMPWNDFDVRAARLAAVLGDFGIGRDSKVAHYMYNGPEYLLSTFAAFKLRAVPVNVNYRYTETELEYLLTNSDSEAIVVDSALAGNLVDLRDRLPKLRVIIQTGEGPFDDGVLPFDQAVSSADPAARIDRSMQDLWFLYTGGTTGMPKGVMWPHGSLLGASAPTFRGYGLDVPGSPGEVADAVNQIQTSGEPIRQIPAAPLMHGTSSISSIGVLSSGGTIVTLTSRSFDPAELLAAVERWKVTNLTIVGDAFAGPILDELDASEQRGAAPDVSSLRIIVSSGVMWSQPVKDALLQRLDVVCADLLGSSEGTGFATSVAKRGRTAATARFKLGPNAQVLNSAGRPVQPGSGEQGMLAVGGPIPVGYYKDPDKTAETFREVDGRVWSIPGDFAQVESDGVITLLGRGSVCINTAGEKVYPEEVEETIKLHPAVADCNVVGRADVKWGQAVCAVVSLRPSWQERGEIAEQLRAHCRETLAGYKIPKEIVVVDEFERGPNGKSDYRWAARIVSGS